MKNVQVSRAGAVIGQFEPTEVRQGLIEGKFLASDHYWIPGMKGWMPLSQFNEGSAGSITPSASKPKAGRKLTGWLSWKVSLVPDKMGFADWTNRFVVAFLCVFYLLLFWLLLKYDAKSTKVSVRIEIPARAIKEEPRALAPVVIAQPTQVAESKPPVALERPASPVTVSRASNFEEIKAAAEQGDMMAQFIMGDYYSLPVGDIVRDDDVGFSWYLKAARQGLLAAQVKVWAQYCTGLGTKRDYVEAYAWAVIAATGGDEDSRRACQQIYVNMLSRAQEEPARRRRQQLSSEIAAEKDARKGQTGK